MKEFISTFTSKGQVTIPAELRKYLGISTNDKIGSPHLDNHRQKTYNTLKSEYASKD